MPDPVYALPHPEPRLTDLFERIYRGLLPHARPILRLLNVYDRFDIQPTADDEDLSEDERLAFNSVARVVTQAAAISVLDQPAAVREEIQRLVRDPSQLPHLAEESRLWVAHYYRRGEEAPGTYRFDILGADGITGHHALQSPSEANVTRAAELYLSTHPQLRGRAVQQAKAYLADQLGMLFRASGRQISRQTTKTGKLTAGGNDVYTENGEFQTFLRIATSPLIAFLEEYDLPLMRIDPLVRVAQSSAFIGPHKPKGKCRGG